MCLKTELDEFKEKVKQGEYLDSKVLAERVQEQVQLQVHEQVSLKEKELF